MEEAMDGFHEGVRVGDLKDVWFTCVQAMIASSQDGPHKQMDGLYKAAGACDMKINIAETKPMVVSIRRKKTVQICVELKRKSSKQVTKLKYQEVLITEDGRSETEVKQSAFNDIRKELLI